MEQTLKDILKELKFQTKLMENIFHAKDSKNVNAQHMQKGMAMLMSNIGKMPGMNQPEAQKILNDLMAIIPGG
jgi:ketopantoate reductase